MRKNTLKRMNQAAMGLIFLASNLGYLPREFWNLWPIILIVVGLGGLLTSDNDEWDVAKPAKKSSKKKTTRRKKKKQKLPQGMISQNIFFHIAIDGPVAAGKGTVSRLVAERLGFLYVDTGAMYRVAALLAIQNDVDFEDTNAITDLIKKSEIKMNNPVGSEKDGRLTTVIVNGEDNSWTIRTEKVGNGSSKVAQIASVREVLVDKQQKIAATQDVVMEGRDITYRVLPNANLKIYLTGKDFVRANRRHIQLQSRGIDISFNKVFSMPSLPIIPQASLAPPTMFLSPSQDRNCATRPLANSRPR